MCIKSTLSSSQLLGVSLSRLLLMSYAFLLFFQNHPTTKAFVIVSPFKSNQTPLPQSQHKTVLLQSSSSELTLNEEDRSSLPPPPCPKSNPNDDIFRSLRRNLPVEMQNWMRDSGLLRTVVDGMVYFSLPGILQKYPQAATDFLKLSSAKGANNNVGGAKFTKMRYGHHPMQVLHLMEPQSLSSGRRAKESNGTVVFCHGGAWGSGRPWMYRLVAKPFLQANMAVAVVGYRTYPDADVNGQVQDIDDAVSTLACRRPDLLQCKTENDEQSRGVVLVGHSSGAHIGLLMLLEKAKKRLDSSENDEQIKEKKKNKQQMADINFDHFIGLSGVYCISSHYEFESGRGVDEISPLKPACGYCIDGFVASSPKYRLERILESSPLSFRKEEHSSTDECNVLDDLMPNMLFVHGIDDSTVPYTSSLELVDKLRSAGYTKCDDLLLEGVEHVDTVFHLMMGGKTEDEVMMWLRQES